MNKIVPMPTNADPASHRLAPYRFCVAPMMGYSHRHFLAFMRLITRHGLLFTQMLPADAVCVNPERLCDWRVRDFPIAVQLGGSDGKKLARAVGIIADIGACEVNLNMGCPSPRVQKGAFGAALMCTPDASAELVAQMTEASDLPVTVKLRIGVDDHDSEDTLHCLIDKLHLAGASAIYLHARKACLKRLNPKQNREIPPLRYDVAARVKAAFPNLPIVLNGGIADIESAANHCRVFDGVMVGRAAVNHPMAFAAVDAEIFGQQDAPVTRQSVFQAYWDYVDDALSAPPQGSKRYQQTSLRNFVLQPLFALMYGERGAKQWRRNINDVICRRKHWTDLQAMQADLV